MNCEQAYSKYPQHHKWFNKLYVAELFGYDCGPCGTAPTKDGTYIVRPIYNLSGMGVGAKVVELSAGDLRQTPPGYFWCEYLTGKHYSADYTWKGDRDFTTGEWLQAWEGTSCWEGTNMPINLTKFIEWKRSSYIPEVPEKLNSLRDVNKINIEFKGNRVIEVHLRSTPDPAYDHVIPVWATDDYMKRQHFESHGFKYVVDPDDADGHIDQADARLGFLVK
jgi:hypothetical protein